MRKRLVAVGIVIALSTSMASGTFAETTFNNESKTEISEERQVDINKIIENNTDTYDKKSSDIIDKAVNESNGETKAELLNSIDNEDAFENGVKKVLNEYYDDMGNTIGDKESFEKSIDSKATEIINNYEEAAEERASASQLDYDVNSIIVSFDSKTDDQKIKEVVEKLSDDSEIITGMYSIDETLPEEKKTAIQEFYNNRASKMVVVNLSKDQTTERAMEEYGKIEEVKGVERNEYTEDCGSGITDDPYSDKQWYLDKINTSSAWDTINGANECGRVIVAVIDSGVDINHDDLKGKIRSTSADITGDKPVLLSKMSTPYITYHGTMVTSIISAKSNNKVGISGIVGNSNTSNGYGCSILAIQAGFTRVYEWDPSSVNKTYYNLEDEIKAIEYAVANGADIINMSISGKEYSQQMQNLISEVRDSGILVVAAAGNFSTNENTYPSDYNGVISVIGLNSDDSKLGISSYGSNKDISAPGFNIFACKPGNSYGVDAEGGTSYAAPMVAATAAIMKGLNPKMTPAEIEYGLKVTATDIGAEGKDEYTANGRVDVGLAAQRAVYKSYYGIKPEIMECSSETSGKIKVKWKRIANEEQVSIYRATSKNGTYEKVANVDMKSDGARSYIDNSVKTGVKYYYKVRPRSNYGDGFKYGEYSDVVSCTAS